ncbi:MAG: cupredoxin domain-containing protein [Phycisphaeraceae bacterium]
MRTETLRFMIGLFATLTFLAAIAGCETADNGGVFGTTPDPAEAANVVRVSARDFRFTPATITVEPGETVEIQLVNEGDAEHNIEFELPQGEVALDQNVMPGNMSMLRFSAPSESDEYTFYCPVNNHREMGMEGTLIVREGAME